MKQLLLGLVLTFCLGALSHPAVRACEGDCDPADCGHHQTEKMDHSEHMAPVAEGKDTALDPICGRIIGRSHAVDQVEYEGRIYYFCRKDEKELFLKNPEKYLKEE